MYADAARQLNEAVNQRPKSSDPDNIFHLNQNIPPGE
jgi:hypothetical protein